MYSLFACAAGIFAAASELIPELNKYLGLVKLPEEDNFKVSDCLATWDGSMRRY